MNENLIIYPSKSYLKPTEGKDIFEKYYLICNMFGDLVIWTPDEGRHIVPQMHKNAISLKRLMKVDDFGFEVQIIYRNLIFLPYNNGVFWNNYWNHIHKGACCDGKVNF